jgi:hypothetical protein
MGSWIAEERTWKWRKLRFNPMGKCNSICGSDIGRQLFHVQEKKTGKNGRPLK